MGTTRKYAVIDPATGKIDRRIFSEQTVYDDEMARIFGRSWLMIGHESLVPEPDDFFHTYMGEDPVLVVRQSDGSVKAFLNACSHRGMKVCRADLGNAKSFTCTYHGWTYDRSGALVGVPYEERYRNLDKGRWGLHPVARIESYKGMIFGSFDPAAPTLA